MKHYIFVTVRSLFWQIINVYHFIVTCEIFELFVVYLLVLCNMATKISLLYQELVELIQN